MILASRVLPDGRIAEVFPLTYGRARLGVRRADSLCYDRVY